MPLDIQKNQVKRVEKPWGYEIIYADSELYIGKILFIRKGEALSFQYHQKKDETLYIQQGSVEFVTLDEVTHQPTTALLKEGESIHIPAGMRHRLCALRDTLVLEVSNAYMDDIVRLEDRYGRV